MKTWISFAALVCALLGQARSEEHVHAGHVHGALPQAGPASKDSLYQLTPKLVDQNGQALRLDAFKGRPVVVAMFFASCTSVCPLTIADIQRVEKALSPADRDRLGVLLVSFDGRRDGPAAFKEVIARHGIATDRWRLATASDDDVRTLAAALGIKYTRQPDGSYLHSAVLTVLDDEGEIDARTEGVMQPVDALVAAIAGTPRN